MWDLPPYMQSHYLARIFDQAWAEELARAKQKNTISSAAVEPGKATVRPSLLRVIARLFWRRWLCGGLLYIIWCLTAILQPMLVRQMVNFLQVSAWLAM